jgi:hypothetical protein
MRGIARLCARCLFVVALLVLVVGLKRDWIAVGAESTTTQTIDQTKLKLVIDPARIHADATTAWTKFGNLAQNAQAKVLPKKDRRTLAGKINRVDVAERRLVLANVGAPKLRVQVDHTTTVRLNEETVPLSALAPGDEATVVLVARDDATLAEQVSASR